MIDFKTHEPSVEPLVVFPISLTEFLLKKLPPRDNILAPWLQKSGLAMVYAERGIGKTYFALSVMLAVAHGGEFLSFYAPHPLRVLYIDGEMSGISMQDRLKMLIALIQPNPFMIDPIILTPDLQPGAMPNLSTSEGQDAIEQYIEQADLIIVDNISTLCGYGRENEADSWNVMQAWALSVRRRGKSVLFIHHAGKNGSQRGTSKREDILDTVICLKRPSDYEPNMGATFELHFEKSRGVMGDDVMPLRCELTVKGWVHAPLEVGNYARVVELYKDGIKKQTEIAREIGLSPAQVSRHIKKAKCLGDIRE